MLREKKFQLYCIYWLLVALDGCYRTNKTYPLSQCSPPPASVVFCRPCAFGLSCSALPLARLAAQRLVIVSKPHRWADFFFPEPKKQNAARSHASHTFVRRDLEMMPIAELRSESDGCWHPGWHRFAPRKLHMDGGCTHWCIPISHPWVLGSSRLVRTAHTGCRIFLGASQH
jgi:hypothetical protein